MVDSQRGLSAKLATIISYPTRVSGIIVLLKMPTNYQEFFLTLFVKTADFQLVFNFVQTRTVTIWRAWYKGLSNDSVFNNLNYLAAKYTL